MDAPHPPRLGNQGLEKKMQVPALFNNYPTLESIVATINEGGTAMCSVAEIAGYYAFDAATDNIDSDNDVEKLSDDDFSAHLEILSEAGANFDMTEALENAKARQAYAVACLHSSDE